MGWCSTHSPGGGGRLPPAAGTGTARHLTAVLLGAAFRRSAAGLARGAEPVLLAPGGGASHGHQRPPAPGGRPGGGGRGGGHARLPPGGPGAPSVQQEPRAGAAEAERGVGAGVVEVEQAVHGRVDGALPLPPTAAAVVAAVAAVHCATAADAVAAAQHSPVAAVVVVVGGGGGGIKVVGAVHGTEIGRHVHRLLPAPAALAGTAHYSPVAAVVVCVVVGGGGGGGEKVVRTTVHATVGWNVPMHRLPPASVAVDGSAPAEGLVPESAVSAAGFRLRAGAA